MFKKICIFLTWSLVSVSAFADIKSGLYECTDVNIDDLSQKNIFSFNLTDERFDEVIGSHLMNIVKFDDAELSFNRFKRLLGHNWIAKGNGTYKFNHYERTVKSISFEYDFRDIRHEYFRQSPHGSLDFKSNINVSSHFGTISYSLAEGDDVDLIITKRMILDMGLGINNFTYERSFLCNHHNVTNDDPVEMVSF